MKITPALLVAAVGCQQIAADFFAEPLDETCTIYEINTPARLAAFLAQIAHESGAFRWVREIWGPTPAQVRYEGRLDLGNSQPGDGKRFAGKGLLQVTGRANYRILTERLRARWPTTPEVVPDFEANPVALESPRWAALSAGDFWDRRGLNALADAGNFDAITQRINGGQNGAEDRRRRWKKAKIAIANEGTT